MTIGETGNDGNGGIVIAVSRDATHRFSKENVDCIRLIAGHGVEGDAHAGVTVQHLSRIAQNPNQPNLRQIHLIHAELHDELRANGFTVAPGEVGENITTRDIDLLALPRGTRLRLGNDAVVEITGLRNPCLQLDRFQSGLMQAVLDRGLKGELVRKSGVMGVVVAAGEVRRDDPISVALPPEPYFSLAPV